LALILLGLALILTLAATLTLVSLAFPGRTLALLLLWLALTGGAVSQDSMITFLFLFFTHLVFQGLFSSGAQRTTHAWRFNLATLP